MGTNVHQISSAVDSNSLPSDYESPTLTTRPELPPKVATRVVALVVWGQVIGDWIYLPLTLGPSGFMFH